MQHRKARGVGGSNGPENLVVLCGSATSQGCHLLCEQRSEEMTARGLVVPSWNDPLEIPVILYTGEAVYLTTAGTYSDHWVQPDPCGPDCPGDCGDGCHIAGL